MTDQSAELEWRDGRVPVSTRFDDPYYSLDNGLDETRHVFLGGNDLPARFCDGFHIAELGFGTGLNLLCALQAFRGANCPGKLRFTTFEAFPMAADDMIAAQATFPDIAELAAELQPFWRSGETAFETDDLRFTLIPGDARATLPAWTGVADAWFLDGFSPAKNPELWGPEILAEVARHTAENGSAATYTAAGHVRRALEAGGFTVTRVPGFGRKRHMTRAVK
ncbi:tRNA (5-methylaminomethyl-2-thiouridine)(34)-methyltransferase MnmD [Marinovum sp. 2_MG-2023]|uniref:tRNA (5-methylaminomethyl-2-thiouridine)(34)-methyltransferase MnmD n=1 Tax=unclassified Marinovum TaxID=2647166 RepID=UPI0026E178F8|nr:MULTISPECIES: tRNA (5-methylaminomethyl-2-thiouridine)(34)-methyltransferase MnmD [unclassified Marinovum]MDO6729690.1 tRNA (5-methylaminomethyl-2-thiouridine)(34)-methyltransferase MnmD [Marinovum sp. 2_MG-2023]MDO6779504.1 tRNA (5-methylaminomethyl-2-thiouridine)(34)-methyltransferase MnmD [Marinovum sp. 1_MG-2023]